MQEVIWTGFGPDALDALAQAVRSAKESDPLAPVTILVESSYARLALRRSLATRIGTGTINVQLLGVSDFARLVLAQIPDTPPILSSTAQRALVTQAAEQAGGSISRAAQHAESAKALAALLLELRAYNITPESISHLADGISDTLSQYERLTQNALDEPGALDATMQAANNHPETLASLGQCIAFSPTALTPVAINLLRALPNVQYILGKTGNPEADAWLEPFYRFVQAQTNDSTAIPNCMRVQAPDRDTEVRHAVRQILVWLTEGSSLGSLAICTVRPHPYIPMLQEELERANIKFAGPSAQELNQSVTARTALALLKFTQTDIARDTLIELFRAAPLIHENQPVPAEQWIALIRRMAFSAGIEDWNERATDTAESFQRALQRQSEDEYAHRATIETDITELPRLHEFVMKLQTYLEKSPKSWHERAEVLRETLIDLLQPADWPEAQKTAHQKVLDVLQNLGALDTLTPPPSTERFVAVCDEELSAHQESIGKLGTGVFVGTLRQAIGCEFEHMLVLGMHEGELPTARTHYPFLSSMTRSAIGLPSDHTTSADQYRDFIAAIASAKNVVFSTARTDIRGHHLLRPSRWWTNPPKADPPTQQIASQYAADLRDEPAINATEHLTRTLVNSALPLSADPLVQAEPFLARSVHTVLNRLQNKLTSFDGRIDDHDLLEGLVPSATGLEEYATCPRRFFLDRVLHIEEPLDASELLKLSARDRGTILHEILEKFLRENAPTDPAHEWTDQESFVLHELADAVLDQAKQDGITGRDFWWTRERDNIHIMLENFLVEDENARAELNTVPIAEELAFGYPDSELPAAKFVLETGELETHGHIDRVDRSPDGKTLAIFDYKSGSDTRFKKISDDNCTDHGKHLQLPLYAQAVGEHYGSDNVEAQYWFLNAQSNKVRRGANIGPEQRVEVNRVLNAIMNGVTRGLFPANPGADTWRPNIGDSWDNCLYCTFNQVCAPDRDREWERKATDPVLASYLSLVDETEQP